MKNIALLGVCSDENSSFLRGTAAAPAAIRRALLSDAYNLFTETGVDLSAPGLFKDHGDVTDWGSIPGAVETVMQDGLPAIFLGGDHAVTHPILQSVRPHHGRLSILHFDAHPDLYDDFGGNPASHASPFARIMEQGLTDRLVQVGIRAATRHQREQMSRFGVEVLEMREWRDDLSFDFDTPLYISLDVDALDPAYAPGVSHPEPGGLTPRQIIGTIQRLRARIVAADLVEVNPSRDPANLTATVAAKLLKEIAGKMLSPVS